MDRRRPESDSTIARFTDVKIWCYLSSIKNSFNDDMD